MVLQVNKEDALRELHVELNDDLRRIASRFVTPPKITLVIRHSEKADGGCVLSDDDLELAIGEIRRLQEKAEFVFPGVPGPSLDRPEDAASQTSGVVANKEE